MREWFTPAEIARAAGRDLPTSERGITRLAESRGWRRDPNRARKRSGRGGGWEYHICLLPSPVQARLSIREANPLDAPEAPAIKNKGRRNELWARFEELPAKHKDAAKDRLVIVTRALALEQAGQGATAAVRAAAKEAGVSPASVFNWKRQLAGVDRADWLAALAPGYGGPGERADCHPEAYAALKSDFLRPERPAFSACYRRMETLAKQHGWAPIPSERALRRHLDADVPKAVQKLAREGRDTAKALYPAQTRTRAHMHAMQAVNMDGHRLDVFVNNGGDKPIRMHLIALQDLFSGKFVAWRLAESENKETVRLVIGDMVERYGIPDAIWLDNGRAFASKWISGGTATRYRFKVREEDPRGLLTALGIDINWTTPYSGQSKPIERAFRDLTEEIARHPICSGAYTGNRPDAKPENYASRAIPEAEFRAHVAARIAEHNARSGRNTETAAGRSFDETFNTSLAEAIVRRPTSAQKALWLLAAERIRTRKGNGEIHFAGNRYWAEELTGHAGKYVTVRFDPDALRAGISVYDASDRLIARATAIDVTGFDSTEAAKTHAKNRSTYIRALREQQRLHAELSAEELARMHGALPAPEPEEPVRPKVTRLATALAKPVEKVEWDERAEASFSNALRLIAGGQ